MQKILDDIAHINAQNLYINDYRNFLETDLKIENSKYIDIPKDDNYEIEFKNVSFKYPRSKEYTLENVSIAIKSGEKLSVVGLNGAGETTFIKLLTRLYEPTEGEILLNGANIKEHDYKDASIVVLDEPRDKWIVVY